MLINVSFIILTKNPFVEKFLQVSEDLAIINKKANIPADSVAQLSGITLTSVVKDAVSQLNVKNFTIMERVAFMIINAI